MNRLTKMNGSLFTLIISLSLAVQSFTIKQTSMKIKEKQAAPDFTIQDVNGATVNLTAYRGKKILLTFHRNTGCPVCNLRFHEIEQQTAYFKSKNLVVIAIYESSRENMKKYLEDETPYAVMIPNPEQNLYKLYDIERSTGKIFKGLLFRGALKKANEGKKLYRSKMKQDGNANTIGADFLIDENGLVRTAYYGKFLGDYLPLEDIKTFLN